MNIMKKKPELFKRAGKSSVIIRNRKFLNNLKENDLHYENKQITQCVFLGVLRLKPVPSVFSNNVPSVSTTVENNSPIAFQSDSSNQEPTKSVSKKNNINKVLTGKISKKYADKEKTAVKKVPTKPTLKIKLKKSDEPSTSNCKQTVTSDVFSTGSDAVITTTLSLNPITSPTKFNPVQNLFDKLKQQRDEGSPEAGPSKMALYRAKCDLKSSSVKYKVCKISANGRNSPNDSKKLKKNLYKKSNERLAFPLISTSPITISDTESTGKRDKDDIILLDESKSNHSNGIENATTEGIIIINDELPKGKEKISPRLKNSSLNQDISNEKEKQNVIVIPDEQKVDFNDAPPGEIHMKAATVFESAKSQEVIVISDEPKETLKMEKSNSDKPQNDTEKTAVIVTDEVREIRVSPRLKQNQEKMKTTSINITTMIVDEVINIVDEDSRSNKNTDIQLKKKSEDNLKIQELNITIDSQQMQCRKEPTSPRLLKVSSPKQKVPQAVKKEVVESEVMVVQDKPKRKKNTTSTLLPPMLLNAPMLLRSELAPKKTNYMMPEKSKVRKTRNKIKESSCNKSAADQLRNINQKISMKLIDTKFKKESFTVHQTVPNYNTPTTSGIERQPSDVLPDEVICINDSSLNKNENNESTYLFVNVNAAINVIENIQEISTSQELTETQYPKNSDLKMPEDVISKKDIIIHNHYEINQKTKSAESKITKLKIPNPTPKIEATVQESDDVIIVKEENNSKEKISPMLLRSDISKQKILQNPNENNITNPKEKQIEYESLQSKKDNVLPPIDESISLVSKSDTHTSPRVLRSNLNKKSLSPSCIIQGTDLTVENNLSQSEKVKSPPEEPQLNVSECKSGPIPTLKLTDLEEIIVVNKIKGKSQRSKTGNRLLRSNLTELTANKSTETLVKPELKEVVVMIHEKPKQKPKSPVSPKKSDVEQPCEGDEDVTLVSINQKKNQDNGKSPRSLRSDTLHRVNFPECPKIMKMEKQNRQQLDVEDFQNIKIPLNKSTSEKMSRSHRLLRSEIARNKFVKANCDRDTDVNNVASSQRLLRSDISLQKKDENIPKAEQTVSPRIVEKRNCIQESSEQVNCEMNNKLQLIDDPNKREANDSAKDVCIQVSTSTKTSASKRKLKNILNKQTVPSKKVVLSKKRGRKMKYVLSGEKTKIKTSMLLRSELAQLKNAGDFQKLIQKEGTQKGRKFKLKKSNNYIQNRSTESTNVTPDLQDRQKNRRSVKAKSVTSKSDDSSGVATDKNLQINDCNENSTVQDYNEDDSKTQNSTSIENIKQKRIDAMVSVDVPVPVVGKKNNSPKKNRSENQLNNDTADSSDVLITESRVSKRNSPRNSKSPSKRKVKETEGDDKPVNSDESVKNLLTECTPEQSICDNLSKTADITVFDFHESEPEVLPLRLNTTPRKEKSAALIYKDNIEPSPTKGNVTPKAKKQKGNGSVTKAQAKVKLLNVFEEDEVKQNSLNIPQSQELNKITKAKSPNKKRKVKDQNIEDQKTKKGKTRRGKKKVSLNENIISPSKEIKGTSADTLRTSTSPLKQTTITDMFNRVMLKKEKSSVDTVFEPATKESSSAPQVPNRNENAANDMPPPSKSDRKPPPKSERDQDEPDDDDSDCESRVEWIPEEYAEYKFKYSAKKMMTYKPIYKCKICLLILPTYYKLSKHKEEHTKKENPYDCKHCDQAFSNVEDLMAHLRIHKGKHPYICKKCEIGFWSKKDLDDHTPIHVLRKVKQPNKRFRCDVCAKEFSKLCDMERHTRVHTGEKPCVCNICNKRFQQSHNLSKHLLTHLHVKPFHCEICNKQFGRNDVLNRHLLTHSVEKPIKCPLCPKGFIRQTQLNNHMKKNHPDVARIQTKGEPTVTEAT